ncbi:MAG TPA: HYR domain-containing protein, partial [Phaeodactylibacter sp.]|nr:HYR domain-containing protein [Phaeodactylibacter sp.]
MSIQLLRYNSIFRLLNFFLETKTLTMKQFFTLLLLCVSLGLFAQVSYTANDQVTPYTGGFRPGVNPAFYNGWTDQQVADLAAGNSLFGVPGIGAKALRTAISDDFVTQFGMDYLLPTYAYYQSLGLVDNTCIVGFPHPSHKEQVEYCSGIQSEMFAGLYEDIWDGGLNGTPYNDNNLFAAYLYEVVVRYKDYITFWEIWNEPGLDYTGNCGWREPGDPVCNWWDNNPDPCDYKLRAPIYSYVRTLRIAYDIIKTLDPDAYVVVAGVGFESFLDAALRNTDNPVDGSVTPQYPYGAGAYFDVMGFHSYPHFDGTTIYYDNTIPGLAFERNSDRAAFGIPFKQNIRQAVLANYGYDGVTYPKKEWIITEANVARSVYQDAGGNYNYLGGEEVQKNYIIKAVANSIRYNINQYHVFRLAEREYTGTASYSFDVMGLYQRLDETTPYNQTMNIEGMAYKTVSDCLYGTTWDEAKTNQMNLPAGVGGGAFKQANGEYVYCIWAITTLDESEVANANYSFPASFGYSNLYKKDWDFSQTFASTSISANNIALTGTPIFLTTTPFVPPASITLTCPADVTVFASQNANGAVVNYNPPNVSTTCASGLMMTLTGGLASGSTFPLGVTQVEYEATDDCGNVVICSFNVTVQSPVGGCPSVIGGFTFLGEHNTHKYFISNAIAKPADAQLAAQTVGGHLAVINDQAENTFIQQNISDLVYIGLNDVTTEGQMEWINGDAVTYTNYDLCTFCTGNSADDDYVVMHPWNGGWSYSNQFNQRLYVIELPCNGGGNNTTLNITCPANLDLTTSGPGATVAANWSVPTTTGDCTMGNVSVTQTAGPNNGSSLGAGVYNITYTATDGCGNSATCSFVVTILEGLGSSCPGDIAGFTALGEFGGHKYYLSDAIAKPVAAAANAVANNGYLVAINSQAENDFIQQNVSDMVYIGLNDVGTEGSLVWGNGDPLTYNNVNPCGFCNANTPDLDYVIMQPWDGGW